MQAATDVPSGPAAEAAWNLVWSGIHCKHVLAARLSRSTLLERGNQEAAVQVEEAERCTRCSAASHRANPMPAVRVCADTAPDRTFTWFHSCDLLIPPSGPETVEHGNRAHQRVCERPVPLDL